MLSPSSSSSAGSHAVVALLVAVMLATVLATASVAAAAGVHDAGPQPAADSAANSAPDINPQSAAITQPAPCDTEDDSARLGYLSREYDYAAGLANDTAADWTGGEVLRIGATGDCSLAVANGSAALAATRVPGQRGVLRATVDVGEGGALRVVAGNGTNASVALENVGRENGVAVAVVARHANGSTSRTRLTAPSGRFVDLAMRVEADGTIRVALREATARTPPDEWDARVATGATNATWTVELRSRAYLDDVAVGAEAPPTPTPTPPEPTPTETESELFDEPTPGAPDPADPPPGDESGESSGQGLVLGPVVALVGGGIYRFAYGLARFDEQTDAIGSKTPASEVEPADWNVALTKGFGALVALAGVGWFLSAVASAL